MDAATILRIKPELRFFLRQFDDFFGRVSTRRYLDIYVEGQLGPLQRKSVEPIADSAGEPPRNLQQFLSAFRWDQDAVCDQVQRHVAREHLDELAAEAAQNTGVSETLCRAYLGDLDYALSYRHLAGLTDFFRRLTQDGLVPDG